MPLILSDRRGPFLGITGTLINSARGIEVDGKGVLTVTLKSLAFFEVKGASCVDVWLSLTMLTDSLKLCSDAVWWTLRS